MNAHLRRTEMPTTPKSKVQSTMIVTFQPFDSFPSNSRNVATEASNASPSIPMQNSKRLFTRHPETAIGMNTKIDVPIHMITSYDSTSSPYEYMRAFMNSPIMPIPAHSRVMREMTYIAHQNGALDTFVSTESWNADRKKKTVEPAMFQIASPPMPWDHGSKRAPMNMKVSIIPMKNVTDDVGTALVSHRRALRMVMGRAMDSRAADDRQRLIMYSSHFWFLNSLRSWRCLSLPS
mmetsp:Transcript_4032/g.11425  ORF Transcript_4032/g.11425 Transcript_4032/m.11425 type:complete len:235 (-) Transcript_4032:1082-1786(-)